MVDYEHTFGAPEADDTGVALRLFFENGGQRAYVVRTAISKAAGSRRSPPSISSTSFPSPERQG